MTDDLAPKVPLGLHHFPARLPHFWQKKAARAWPCASAHHQPRGGGPAAGGHLKWLTPMGLENLSCPQPSPGGKADPVLPSKRKGEGMGEAKGFLKDLTGVRGTACLLWAQTRKACWSRGGMNGAVLHKC